MASKDLAEAAGVDAASKCPGTTPHATRCLNVAYEYQEEENEGDRALYPDPRWQLLSRGLQALIAMRFGGDLDEAFAYADQLCHSRSRAPAWAAELHVIHMRKLGKICWCGGVRQSI